MDSGERQQTETDRNANSVYPKLLELMNVIGGEPGLPEGCTYMSLLYSIRDAEVYQCSLNLLSENSCP